MQNVKDQNRIPELRFPGFHGGWDNIKIDDIGKTYNGLTGKTKDDFGMGKKYITYKQIFDSNKIDIAKCKLVKIQENEHQNEAGYGDVFFTTSSETPLEVGFSSVLLNKNEKAYLNSFCFGYRPNSLEKLDPNFSRYYFRNPCFRKEMVRLAQGSTRFNMSKSAFLKIQIQIPSLAEQKKIAEFLGSVDAWIENLEEQKESWKNYKKGMMQKLFPAKDEKVPELRFPEFNGKWEEKFLSLLENDGLIEVGRGEIISKDDIKNMPGDFPIYSSSTKNNGLFGKYGNYIFNEEMITWSIDGGGHFFHRSKHKFSVTNVSGWIRIISKKINCKFLSIYLQLLHERENFDYQSKAHPSVIKNVYKVKLPEVEEQKKIADFLSAINDVISEKDEEIAKAREWKKGLMQKMFV